MSLIFEEKLPKIKINPSEGTYLLWIDFTKVAKKLKNTKYSHQRMPCRVK